MDIWVIEMKNETQWEPTVGARLNREDARKHKKEWEERNPTDEFRITQYRSKKDGD